MSSVKLFLYSDLVGVWINTITLFELFFLFVSHSQSMIHPLDMYEMTCQLYIIIFLITSLRCFDHSC